MNPMARFVRSLWQPSRLVVLLCLFAVVFIMCGRENEHANEVANELAAFGMNPQVISAEDFLLGTAPLNFQELSGAPYKPSHNEEPNIPPQCWIETSYGTQNACKYCHTDYLTGIRHGNAFDIGEDQILFSFPTANLNHILWRNIIYPHEIEQRLAEEGIAIPSLEDVDYVRQDNWRPAFAKARANGNTDWINFDDIDSDWSLFPALNPDHLFPYEPDNPTGNGTHGYVGPEGFVMDEAGQYTGWRAVNFFPYTIFTPLTGSVSGIYIRLPEAFMTYNGVFDVEVYKQNLALLEQNIKNQQMETSTYAGDASDLAVNKGFYPVGTEFAHPLHYVDLAADGGKGNNLEAVSGTGQLDYAFPGTRAKRVKEIRYMFKWKEVDLDDIAIDEDEENGYAEYVGREGQGWVDNDAGWILAAYIEDRHGNLRPQTTEELVQCIGCHGNVGNTVDAVWSFQRKLPGDEGWGEMDYGNYDAANPTRTQLQDYLHMGSEMGELGYFYYTVVGADLYGVMPSEVQEELTRFIEEDGMGEELGLIFSAGILFDDDQLKNLGTNERKAILLERQRVMRHYASESAYLDYDGAADKYFVKGSVFYPTPLTMKANIQAYRKIVLDQSYNLGKDVFGSEAEHVPFTFRSDGTVVNHLGAIIPVGQVITSRPYDEEGVGTTPTGLVAVNEDGEPIDAEGIPVGEEFYRAVGHISKGGTFDMMYNPILSDRPFRPTR
jgi:hypothetical protein